LCITAFISRTGKPLLLLLCFAILSSQSIYTLAAPRTTVSQPQVSTLQLGSVSAAILDTRTGELVHSKNADTVMPIASLSKLMSAMVLLDAAQPMDEFLTIQRVRSQNGKNSYSRLRPGSQLKRKDLLHISLMSSENLATYNLAVHYPGGMPAFIKAMNAKAKSLNMGNTRFNDAAGLSLANVSTANDVVKMVIAASGYPLIHEYSTTRQFTARFRNPGYVLGFGNTNRLVHNANWDISLSKTGYLSEAGRCLALLTRIDGRNLVVVLLDSFGKQTHIGDAARVKNWLHTGSSGKLATSAYRYQTEKSRKLGISTLSASSGKP
jgi:D-alanyl-D-alanine endopeptidase (penicillin-binding protein 7)